MFLLKQIGQARRKRGNVSDTCAVIEKCILN